MTGTPRGSGPPLNYPPLARTEGAGRDMAGFVLGVVLRSDIQRIYNFSPITVQLHISAGYDHRRQVQSCRCHKVTGYDIITDRNKYHSIEKVGERYRLDVARNQIPVRQMKIVVSGHAGADRTDHKFAWRSTGSPDAIFYSRNNAIQMDRSRIDFTPATDNANL